MRMFSLSNPRAQKQIILYHYRKDDAEILAGEMISQILVPHPALGFPKNITLTYLAYKGWLTRGLSSWSIEKIILSDGFGKRFRLNFLLSGDEIVITVCVFQVFILQTHAFRLEQTGPHDVGSGRVRRRRRLQSRPDR